MSTLQVKVGGTAYTIQEATLTIKSRVDDKDTATFTLIEPTGTVVFSKGQTVSITDSVQGNLFSGFVNKPTCTNLFPNATNLWSMDCVNQFYVPAKRTHKRLHKGQHAAPIVALQVQEYLEPDGVSGNFGLDWTELQSDWQAGQHTGTVATTNTSTGNTGAGDLELNTQGTPFTWSGSASVVTNQAAIAMTGYASSGYGTAYSYREIWTGTQAITTGDFFQYDIWIASTSPQIMSGVDFVCSDGTTFTSTNTLDNQGLSCAPTTDLSGIATDQWYTRPFTMPSSLNGKTLVSVQVFFAGSNAGTYASYFRNITYFISSPGTNITIFGITSTLAKNVQTKNIGYNNVTLSQVNAGDKSQLVELFPGSFGVVGIVQTSRISWTENLPSGCTAKVETSIDASATWQLATNGTAIPNLLPGMVAGTGFNNPYLDFQVTFTLGTDPTAIASLSAIQITINPSYQSTKTDYTKTWQLNSDFSTGTFTNLVNNTILGEGIQLNGFQRNWNDAGYTDQVLWGAGSPSQTVINQQMVLTTGGSNVDVRSQFGLASGAGQWQNFTMNVDLQVPASTNEMVGVVYRTTNWANGNNSGAWVVDFRSSEIELGYGSNAGTGAGTYTNVSTVTLSFTASSWHTLTLVVNGTSHKVYVDNVLLINVTNSTYNQSGYTGLHAYNNSGATKSYYFDNFGICAALSGTWKSASTSIAGPGTYGGSLVQWDVDSLPDNTTSISVQTSLDSGSTWQSVSNGGAITGLTSGQSLTGVNLLLLVTLTASHAPVVPAMKAISLWILGAYSSTGTRTNAPLAWDSMTRLPIGSGWGNASNQATYTQTGTGTTAVASNEATITNTTGDVHMSLPGSGGDMDGTVRFSLSAATISAGIELRYSNANSFYRLQANTTTVSIVKAGGPTITLASTAMALTTGVYYWFRFRVVGSGVGAPLNLYGKVWQDQTTEPTAWTLTTTD